MSNEPKLVTRRIIEEHYAHDEPDLDGADDDLDGAEGDLGDTDEDEGGARRGR